MKYSLSLVLFILLAFNAKSQKMVVFEKFTNMRCGQCPNAALIVKEIIADNPNVIWISHHKPYEGNPLTNPISDDLWDAMEVPGPPIGMVDRKILDTKILSFSGKWRDRIEAQASLTSPVDVEIQNVVFDAASHTLSFDAEAIFTSIPGPGPHNLTAYIIEDSIYGRQESYFNETAGHPLEGLGDPIWNYWHNNVVRTILDDLWGTNGVIPDTPELNVPYTNSYSYQVPGAYNPTQLSIVVTVSKFNDQDNTDRLIYNGTKFKLSPIISSNKNLEQDLGIVLSPNPAKAQLKLDIDKVPQKITIVDVTGRPVLKLTDLSTSMRLDISGLSSGLYYLLAQTQEGIATKSFTILP